MISFWPRKDDMLIATFFLYALNLSSNQFSYCGSSINLMKTLPVNRCLRESPTVSRRASRKLRKRKKWSRPHPEAVVVQPHHEVGPLPLVAEEPSAVVAPSLALLLVLGQRHHLRGAEAEELPMLLQQPQLPLRQARVRRSFLQLLTLPR